MSVTVTIETPELTLSKTRHPSGSSHQQENSDFFPPVHVACAIASLVETLDASKIYPYSVRERLLEALNRQEEA